jgi:citrate synthase
MYHVVNIDSTINVSGVSMAASTWMSATEAARLLDVSRATLYAYVSRGFVRSRATTTTTSRERRYSRDDVERLRRRTEERRHPDKAAAHALQWGMPILESAITLIDGGRLYYRGHDAVMLSRTRSIAEVASLIWSGSFTPHPALSPTSGRGNVFKPLSLDEWVTVSGEPRAARTIPGARGMSLSNILREAWGSGGWRATGAPPMRAIAALPFVTRAQALLASAAARDPAAFDLQPGAVMRAGWRILNILTRAAIGDTAMGGAVIARSATATRPMLRTPGATGPGASTEAPAPAGAGSKRGVGPPAPQKNPKAPLLGGGGQWGDGETTIDATLAIAWGVNGRGVDLIRAALILCADHELNVSSFTARCVASAGSHPYAVVIAGLAALEGTRHGGASARVEAMLAAMRRTRDPRGALAERLRRGETIDGFGHPLYPDGDPRATALLAMMRERYARSIELAFVLKVADAASAVLREQPNVDFALAALSRVLRLPPGSALTLFAIGRTIGWIGHAIEQYATGQLIRPRARYTGVTVGITSDVSGGDQRPG